MELPSMVQRSGDTLIVRSVVSGDQLYMDQGSERTGDGTKVGSHAGNDTHSPSTNNHHYQHHNSSTSAMEQQLEMLRVTLQQQHYLQQQQQQHQQQQQQQSVALATAHQQAAAAAAVAALELKDEGLPQCKIKRNYSCTYCTYFTQNPRCHLTHLRDVHGEKININKCKLCLYASRHYQKLVRHMKMVHGCTDGISSGHGQSRGKRGMSREARKRKLEASVGLGIGSGSGVGVGVGAGVRLGGGNSLHDVPTLEEVNRELELQRVAYHKQQEEKTLFATNALIVAYGQQLRERQLESLKVCTSYEQPEQAAPANVESHHQRQSPTTSNNNNNNTITINKNNNGGNNNAASIHSQSGFQLPPTNRNLELSPSPAESASSPSSATMGGSGGGGGGTSIETPSSSSTPTSHQTSVALSLTYADDPPQNRLLKCSICDYTTLYRAQLRSHEFEEHEKTKFFRCEKCSYVTHIKTRFSKHVKYHSMPMIKCVTCDFRTPYKWNLDRHMKNHGGAGPFKCAACDFTADIKQSLTVHEMNHHVPPVGHAAGMSLARRRNKVGGTDLCEDYLSDSVDILDDHFNNNNIDEYEEALMATDPDPDADAECMTGAESYGKRSKYDDEPTDLSQKGGSSDTSSVHNQTMTPKAKRPVPNLIPIPKVGNSVLNLSKDLVASRSSLTDIASMFFSDKQLSEMLQPLDKSDAPQLSPTPTIASTSSHNSRSLLHKKTSSFFDKLKSSALTSSGGPNGNLICPCGHMAKCLSESIIHRKTCKFAAIAEDDIEEEQDDGDGRLEIDFTADDDDKQSHSALNLITGSTRCKHCRHRCKSSTDLLNHLKQCSESYDSQSGESSAGRMGNESVGEQAHHPMENRVFIWNKVPRSSSVVGGSEVMESLADAQQRHNSGELSAGSSSSVGGGAGSSALSLQANGINEDNSYYGVETAPGYGEVTKKMTPEEEAANSSLKKVYKCPHCSFWASTASRFHVHIVGHLNKKPFECSLCSYRSNWRWDITKHIRLKTIRDPNHKNARVLMNDETGRRNYTKYNKYITLMKVTEEDGDPKLMKSGEMTPNQVASLSFLNDFNKSAAGNGSNSCSDGSGASGSGGGASGSGALTGSTHLNGLRDDVTLEPVMSTKMHNADLGADQLSDRFIRLPLLATMVNAAMTQHQQQQQQHQQQRKNHQEQHATLITPSVTISAVKRSPPQLMKPSDDLVADVKQEGSEKKTFYRCLRCSFRHANRDAVLAHVRIHYKDPLKLTGTGGQQQLTGDTNLYNMNEVLAAMCLSQQQQQQEQHNANATNSSNSQQQQQPHYLLSSGLLQQAMQRAATASPNSHISGLALALAGKSSNKATHTTTATSIFEHGEQNASQNEASAPRGPPPPTSPSNTTQQSQVAVGGNVAQGDVGCTTNALQQLLSLPRDKTHHTQAHKPPTTPNSPRTPTTTTTTHTGGGSNSNKSHSSNLVMGGLTTTTAASALDNASAELQQQQKLTPIATTSPPSATNSPQSAAGTPIVTTLPTTTSIAHHSSSSTTTTTTTTSANTSAKQLGAFGGASPRPRLPPPLVADAGIGALQGLISGESVCFGDIVYGSNGSTLICSNSNNTTTPSTIVSTPSPNTTTTSCNLLSNSSTDAMALTATNPSSSSNVSSSSSSAFTSASASSIPSSSSTTTSSYNNATDFINNNLNNLSCDNNNNNSSSNNNNNNNNENSNNNFNGNSNSNCNAATHTSSASNNNNLLSSNGEKREASPYRCGHCHQVSNWKHVIQRHCRLKHTGDIRIETLDRNASNHDLSGSPVYRPLANGATNESNCAMHLKQLQQNHHQHHETKPNHSNNNNNNNNNSTVLMNKAEHLLHSPLTASAAAAVVNAATTPQDLQAAAAYLAAAYKAATANASTDELHQLQHNDQIEVTRLPTGSATNLVQLLESANAANVACGTNAQQQNSKCKQQKCPLCPYISESKSQMNYHISLHKPTQYECTLCTFVCAKKQHLSSHMRSVHQQFSGNGNGNGHGNGNGNTNSGVGALNIDFSMSALHLAAAAQAHKDSGALTTNTPLAIDLTALKHSLNAACSTAGTSQHSSHSTQTSKSAEPQYRIVSYCSKCPTRYARKNMDLQRSRAELEEHLKCHASAAATPTTNAYAYKCEFCDFKAPHETLIQAHRYVHSQHYQDKCAEVYKNSQDDEQHPAPKLMQMTLTKHLQKAMSTLAPENVWIVDFELTSNEHKLQQQQQQQHTGISSSSPVATTTNFEGNNSLLKKQLEAGPAPIPAASNASQQQQQQPMRNSPSPLAKAQQPEVDDSCSNTPSTSASVATSDLAVDAGSDFASASGSGSASATPSPAPLEKCLHCPYETTNVSLYKAHLQQHFCISNKSAEHSCEHCDYSDASKQHIEEHTRLHFDAMEKLKSVAFFTSYDNLELSVEQPAPEEEELLHEEEQQSDANMLMAEDDVTIKQEKCKEHNNNNDDDVVNENTLQEQQQQQQRFKEKVHSKQAADENEDEDENVDEVSAARSQDKFNFPAPKACQLPPHQKPCTKIILYKNAGCLSVKKNNTSATSTSTVTTGGTVANSNHNNNTNTNSKGYTTTPSSDNISDRLRRRISRSSNNQQMNGAADDPPLHNQHNQQQQPQQLQSSSAQQSSHKTVLVNAKTGQVVSRN